jgi:hypothetical protein
MKRIATVLAMVLLVGSACLAMGQVLKGSKATPGSEPAAAEPDSTDSSTDAGITSRKAGKDQKVAQPAAPAEAPAATLAVRKAGGGPSAAASGGGLACTGADGSTACTNQQVYDLNQGILVGRRMHKPMLANVKGVTQGSGGTVECTQDDGSACTDEQVSAVMSVASTTHSSDGEIRIMKEADAASPLMMRKAGGDQNAGVMLAMRKAGERPMAALKCTGEDGSTACTDQQVADVNRGIATGRRRHEPMLMNVKGVTQGGMKGSIVCTQDDGSACTDDQVSAVISVASSTRSSHATIRIVREVDRASP